MRIIHADAHAGHAPTHYAIGDQLVAARDTPARVDALLAAIDADEHEVRAACEHGLEPLRQVHADDYLEFLGTAFARWQQAFPSGPRSSCVVPYAFPNRHMGARPGSVLGQAGHYLSSTTCPIGPGTWPAVRAAAHCAIDAADALLDGARQAYALCRPPGHHAYRDVGAGFCYVNNAAVAAQRLVGAIGRVAILDVDVHHGNGTQGIFWERDDVLFVSVHADPDNAYPFFAGRADEVGAGAGRGFTLNLPVGLRSGDDAWLDAVTAGLDAVRRFGPSALVVSLGFDAYREDPSGLLAVTTSGFGEAAARIGALGLPTLFVQEGGYAVTALEANLRAFLHGFFRQRD